MGDGWRMQKELEMAKMKMLMDDFDSGLFLDETGDFKYTNPDVNAVIRCDDINHLGNASQNQQHDRPETVHGFNTEDLIELQNIKLTDDTPEPPAIRALGNCVSPNPPVSQPRNEDQTSRPAHTHKEHRYQSNSFRGSGRQTRFPQQQQGHGIPNNPPVSQPRNEEKTSHPAHTHKEHKYEANSFPNHGRQTRYPQQQQGHRIPNNPPVSQPRNEEKTSHPAHTHEEHKYEANSFPNHGRQTRYPQHQQGHRIPNSLPLQFQMPYWSPTQPPPPLNNQYTFPPAAPNVNPHFRFGYPCSGAFQNDQIYSRAFNPQNFQRRTRPSSQSFNSRNVFQK